MEKQLSLEISLLFNDKTISDEKIKEINERITNFVLEQEEVDCIGHHSTIENVKDEYVAENYIVVFVYENGDSQKVKYTVEDQQQLFKLIARDTSYKSVKVKSVVII